jgi:predicted lipid-binding transport protein (Tim44 family)
MDTSEIPEPGKRDGTPPTTPPPEVPASSTVASPGGGGAAFAKGGLGGLAIFAILAFITVLLGGHVHFNVGGLIFLFIIGGVIGLIVLSIYNKGRKDAGGSEHPPKPGDHEG